MFRRRPLVGIGRRRTVEVFDCTAQARLCRRRFVDRNVSPRSRCIAVAAMPVAASATAPAAAAANAVAANFAGRRILSVRLGGHFVVGAASVIAALALRMAFLRACVVWRGVVSETRFARFTASAPATTATPAAPARAAVAFPAILVTMAVALRLLSRGFDRLHIDYFVFAVGFGRNVCVCFLLVGNLVLLLLDRRGHFRLRRGNGAGCVRRMHLFAAVDDEAGWPPTSASA